MATFIDEEEGKQEELFDTLQEDQTEQVAEEEPVEEAQEEPSEEDALPERYRNKDIKDIIQMHQEAEKLIGKQGNEVGELRRIVDEFIKSQTVSKQQAPQEDEIDFFADPDKYVQSAIEKHPKVQQAEMLAAQMKKAEALANLKTAHPDFQEVVTSADFQEWVGGSKVRQEMFRRADAQYDFDSAHELISTWKERQQLVSSTKKIEEVGRKQAIKTASTGSAKGTGEVSSKKVYRRQDIIELMARDRDRYEALQPEIMAAYAEGRVR
jgi:hypothetical protein